MKFAGLLLAISMPVFCMDRTHALREAVQHGDVLAVRRVVEAVPEVARNAFVNQYLDQYTENLGKVALHYAAAGADVQKVQYLLDVGADPNCPDYRNKTPLHMACRLSTPEVVEALLKAGASVEAETVKGISPLTVAHKQADADIIALLYRYMELRHIHAPGREIGNVLALATRPRVGADSPMAILPQSLLQDITGLVAQSIAQDEVRQEVHCAQTAVMHGSELRAMLKFDLNRLMKSRRTQREIVSDCARLVSKSFAVSTAIGAAFHLLFYRTHYWGYALKPFAKRLAIAGAAEIIHQLVRV